MAHLLTSPKANPRARARKSLGPALKSSKSRRQGTDLDVFLPGPKFRQEAVSGAKNLKIVICCFFGSKILAWEIFVVCQHFRNSQFPGKTKRTE